MTQATNPSRLSGASDNAVLVELVEEITDRLQAGEVVDIEAEAAAHPEHADELRALLPALRALADLSQSGAGRLGEDGAALGELGDFRIIREVGRGGMGVVYEAEQISLGRRVALKVLPFAATMDPRQLQRFHNEARAAASLHQEHIVPVYAVGCERGVHYYAMQFIDGQTLAEVIARMNGTAATVNVAGPEKDTAAEARATTEPIRDKVFFRRVAEWGIQAAEALEHAHALGVVHRDVKPGNLMIDGQGKLWVTDFGLARTAADSDLTMTGDLLGTLRYMSPEQALSRHGLVDLRSDVYSLGATLYELLTGQPVMNGTNRAEILQQIASDESASPRQVDNSISRELATVVGKALEKEPRDRYATAQELADDLRRWLEDRPILARRPSVAQRMRRWARRNRLWVSIAATVVLVGSVVGGGAGLWWLQQRAVAVRETATALQDAQELLKQRKYPEALSVARRAEPMLAAGLLSEGMGRRVRERLRDLELLVGLEEARGEGMLWPSDNAFVEADRKYLELFRDHGIEVKELTPDEAAVRFQESWVREELAAALDHWAMIRFEWRGRQDPLWRQLMELARIADPDDRRGRLRDAVLAGDPKVLTRLAASARRPSMPPSTVILLAYLLRNHNEVEEAIRLLEDARHSHPGDFWINAQLGRTLMAAQPPRWAEAVRFCTAAVAVRPSSFTARVNLGYALMEQGDLDGAIAEFLLVISRQPDHGLAHLNLGVALYRKGRPREAIEAFQKATHYLPKDAVAHSNLGAALADIGKRDEAIQAGQTAIRFDPGLAEAHYNLATHYMETGRSEEALRHFKDALRLKPDMASAWNNMASTLWNRGRQDEALEAYRSAICVKPDHVRALYNLGNTFRVMGRAGEAIAVYYQATQTDPKHADAHRDLGLLLLKQGRFTEALTALRRAQEIGSSQPGWQKHVNQGVRNAERLVALEARLAALREVARPVSTAEKVLMAELAVMPFKRLYATATRLYSEAFLADPALAETPKTNHRYAAACAAALASCGQGEDAESLTPKECIRVRQQALTWLQADLVAWQKTINDGGGKASPIVVKQMHHWLADTDFNAVRGDAIMRLPEDERDGWQKLWKEVADTLAAASKGKTGEAQ